MGKYQDEVVNYKRTRKRKEEEKFMTDNSLTAVVRRDDKIGEQLVEGYFVVLCRRAMLWKTF